MYVVLLVTALLFLRSFWGMLITLVIIVLSSSSAMGIAGWLGIPITPPSSSAPIMIMTLAVADSVHLIVTLFQSMQKGMTKKKAMAESLRVNLGPVFLTSLTTMIGLLALNFSDVRMFNDLGNIAAIGVFAAFIYTVVVLPPLIAIFPTKTGKKPVGKELPLVIGLGELVIRHRRGLLWFGGGLILFLTVMGARNELNDDFIGYFDDSFEFRRDTDFVRDNLSGIYTMEFSLDSDEEGGVSNPAFLAHVDEFATWLRSQPDMHHVFTVTDTFKRLNKNMHGDDPKWYALPEERELAAQYLLLYEMSLPYGLDLNDTINLDKSATRVIATYDNVTAVRMRELQAESQAWLEANTPKSMWTIPVSLNLMFAHISSRNIKSSLLGALIAVMLIAITLAVAFRSVKYGMLSILPNLAPALMAFGVWGMIRGQIDVGNAIVATMALGIIVDDSVHFLSKYLRARRESGLDAEEATRYAFSTVGSAIIVTSFVLIAGFLVLTLSPFNINASIGLLTAIMILVALGADLLFLPPLLMQMEAPVPAASKAPAFASAQSPIRGVKNYL
jgi:predicted RND superfamily exporter protein